MPRSDPVSGLLVLADSVGREPQRLLPAQRKTQRVNLALLVATMLDVRSANLMDLAAGLPRSVERIDMRFQWIWRVLMNPLIKPDDVIAPFATERMALMVEQGQPLVLILDQTKINQRHQMLMLALRIGGRALPVAWRVVATQGAIGFEVQKDLLTAALAWLPPGAKVCLMADRFYGTANLIALCQGHDWDYRIRLKGNLSVKSRGRPKTTTSQLAKDKVFALSDIYLTAHDVPTHLGIVQDPGHSEPWIIAMPAKPGYLTTMDYSARWAIEPMFSDFKSRGFGLEDSQISYPDRLSRLILVMVLALYIAVSTGQWDAAVNPSPAEKNSPTSAHENSNALAPPCSPEGCAVSSGSS